MKLKKAIITALVCTFLYSLSNAQIDTVVSKIDFEMDFRFRLEQDWNSRKSDGTFRENRSRLRYRYRTGARYTNKEYSFGVRIRTGDPNKQQDPQLTLGKGFKEFGTLPIGFEKVFFQYNKNGSKFWLGKNTFPFEKSNELFWSDNVFPEGVLFEKSISLESKLFSKIKIAAGHFILGSNDSSFFDDAYFQGFQTSITSRNKSVIFFPSFYLFRNIPNIPDGEHSHVLNYSILHLGTKLNLLKQESLSLEFDYYQNIENYSQNTNIESKLLDQKTGFTIGMKYGKLETRNDWSIKLTYANLGRYSILDYMAQNDWARWDYSSYNSPDGRLSNFEGIEMVFAYSISEKINIISKYYTVKQLIPYGSSKETGQRIRFDINIKM